MSPLPYIPPALPPALPALVLMLPMAHPVDQVPIREMLQPGDIYQSPGGSFRYRILGAISRLYDREELPWPHCSRQWRGKAPSWNRQGKRLVVDMATRRSPSYWAQLLDDEGNPLGKPQLLTLYHQRLSPEARLWWFAKTPHLREAGWI